MTTSVKLECLLLHGWGMNHQVWQPVQDMLPDWIQVESIDLPGHGQRSNETLRDIATLVDDIRQQIEQRHSERPLLLVAWSLAALPVFKLLAQDRELVDGLCVVSSNPCFIEQADWPAGIDAQVFEQFAVSLKADFSSTIRRFLSLQVKGSESGRATLRTLREKILQQPVPDHASLDNGLAILKQQDLRAELEQLRLPISWALGGQDGLVKAALVDELKKLTPASEVQLYAKAGHAPFLSHTEEFIQQLESFAAKLVEDS